MICRGARSIALIALLLVPQALGGQALPALPTVARGACPFECCQLGHWISRDTLPLYSSERSPAKPIALLPPGQGFTAGSANFYTLAWGIIAVRRPMRLGDYLALDVDADSIRADPRAAALLTRPLTVGDTMYLIGHEPETGEVVWLDGVSVTVNWFWADDEEGLRQMDAPAVLARPIQHEWWVRIRTPTGREGWIQAWNKRIDGRDACG